MNIMKYVNSWKQNLYTLKKRIFSCTFTDSAMDTYEKVYNMSYMWHILLTYERWWLHIYTSDKKWIL